MGIEPCWLMNHTGAIIRFRTSQVSRLPTEDLVLTVEWFDGQFIPGRFHLHRANPYVAGPRVRQLIQARVPEQSSEQALISVAGSHWRLFEAAPVADEVNRHGVSRRGASLGRMTGHDLSRILGSIDAIAQRAGRTREYNRLLRPPGLRQLVIQLMGASCQVEGCDAAEASAEEWGDPAAGLAIVEVHHIEAVAKVEDHTPGNLCVVCANHHRLIHGLGPWKVLHEDDDVVLSNARGRMRLRRDLAFLS